MNEKNCWTCGGLFPASEEHFLPDGRSADGLAGECRQCRLDRSFWARVNKGEGESCWEWTGAQTTAGYGCLRMGGEHHYAHRLSYEIHHEDPGELLTCHHCDNPSCVNPSHLFLGTDADNLADMRRKGRFYGDAEPGYPGVSRNRGARNGMSKLTAEEVRAIRATVDGGLSRAKTAKRFGVSRTTVSVICSRQRWAHIE